jgi:mono/diheme cytochrome c family protein
LIWFVAFGFSACGGAPGQPAVDALPTPDADVVALDVADVADVAPPAPTGPDWSADAVIPLGTDRGNIYGLEAEALEALIAEGWEAAHVWPVTVSGLLLPYGPMAYIFDPDTDDPTVLGLQDVSRGVLGFGTLPELYDWLGLPAYDEHPVAEGTPVGGAMGAGIISTPLGDAITFSCTACHAGRLVGRTVLGLPNRVTRANRFFELGKTVLQLLDTLDVQALTGATDGEMEMLVESRANAQSIGAKEPMVLGLDTSLAQVALSLARRDLDPYASKSPEYEAAPRPNGLQTLVADSKPMPWWTLKHKTRWLADGSIVSGNPVHTNVLWNEIGRGTDLHELEVWMDENSHIIEALTAAVFATEPPRWTDFFGAETLDLESAKRGQPIFLTRCASCHGTYEKAWDGEDTTGLSGSELLETTRVLYHEQTPIFDVGTDPQRAQGMEHFASRLNELAISQYMETTVEVQTGYVPPPLTGIWARYPYLHNNSVPTLCDLLTPAAQRTAVFWQGPSEDPATDFDAQCVGFPTGDAVPESWKEGGDAFYNTALPGLSNQGHESMFLAEDGASELADGDKMDLVAFLKTL